MQKRLSLFIIIPICVCSFWASEPCILNMSLKKTAIIIEIITDNESIVAIVIFVFFFSLNFEIWDPLHTNGSFSVAKLFGIIYFLLTAAGDYLRYVFQELV